jgi:hypothetical protein
MIEKRKMDRCARGLRTYIFGFPKIPFSGIMKKKYQLTAKNMNA